MQSSRKHIFYLSCAAALSVICIIAGIFYIRGRADKGASSENNKHYVAVITKSTTSAYWKSVFAGANAAGTEYNLELTFGGPENEEDYRTQNEMIERAVINGAEVIVFSAVDFNANADAINNAARQGVKIVVIDSDVKSDQVSSRISTDNFKAGCMAGEAVLNSLEPELYIGIVNFDKNSANGQQREAGFRSIVDKESNVSVVDTINVKSTIEDSKKDTEAMLEKYPEINVIVTFNEWTSLGVGYAVKALGLAEETKVVAFDSNVVSVGMLETGEVDALIVQNPYAMGYLGVETAYNLIFGIPVEEEVNTTTTLITRDNMFDEECQRVLFSFD